MGALAGSSRVLLAVVFAISGTSKALNLASSRKAAADFGLPASLAPLVGNLLPAAELLIAIALLLGPSAWWGAALALGLLLAFITAITVNLLRGRTPDCNCFGRIASAPIGWNTAIRNAGLAGCAALVVAAGPERSSVNVLVTLADAWQMPPLTLIALSAAIAIVGTQTFVLWHVLRQNGRLLVRIDEIEQRLSGGRARMPAGLPIGEIAPDFDVPAVAGGTLGLGDLRRRGAGVLLLFTDPLCQPCAALAPRIAAWQQQYAGRLPIAVISRGEEAASRALAARHGLAHVLRQRDNEVAEAYHVPGTPAGVLIRADGRIGAPLGMGDEGIAHLLATFDNENPAPQNVPSESLNSEARIGLRYGTAVR